MYGMAWFGSVWGGILVRIARVGSLFGSFPLVTDIPHPTERECFPGPPLNSRAELEKELLVEFKLRQNSVENAVGEGPQQPRNEPRGHQPRLRDGIPRPRAFGGERVEEGGRRGLRGVAFADRPGAEL